MAVYKIFPTQDTTIYSFYPDKNTGLDEILDVSITLDLTLDPNPQANRALIQFSTDEIKSWTIVNKYLLALNVPLDKITTEEQKQAIVHRYSLAHKPDGQWGITVSPPLTNEPGEMIMKAVQNHLTLLPAVEGQGETLHLNKLNFRTLQDNSK